MAGDRPFPPSPRRRALARAAGQNAASPVVVGALACGAAAVAIAAVGPALVARLGDAIATACRGGAAAGAAPASAGLELLDLAVPALPVLVVVAVVAALAHVAQARAVWAPRRAVPGAPQVEHARTRRAALELGSAAVVGAVALGWLWAMAPRLAHLGEHPALAAPLIASFLVALAIAWLGLGTLDAVVRHAELARALQMTAAERREDQRLAGADPRWRARRAALARAPSSARDAVAGASVLLLDDAAAVAIAWDPVRRPVPVRTAVGQGARARQLLGLARRHGVPVHREPALTRALAGEDGPVPELQWARLAEIIAATQRRAG